MDNPYDPPSTMVKDNSPEPTPGWLRLVGSVVVSGAIALALAWFVAPLIAGLLTATNAAGGPGASPWFLLVDMLVSFAFFFASSLLAIKLARSRPFIAALGVSAIGWLVYFVEVGGLSGMLKSIYPLWYEFTPVHLASGLLAGLVAGRRRVAGTRR